MGLGRGVQAGMTYATVCSGIGAPEVAWSDIWGPPVFTSEIEAFPSAVLKHHMPDVPNYGDMTKYKEWPDHALDVLIGGTPCQAFSVAGLRRSLEDDRGNLTITFLGLVRKYQPRFTVWENVPGVLNTPDNAFGQFISGLAGFDSELHPTGGRWTSSGFVVGPERIAAWRILNAEYFGVPQRRRRVFIIASPRDMGFAPCSILFEPTGVREDIKTGGKAGTDLARCLKGKSNLSHREDSDTLITVHARQTPISVKDKSLPLDMKGNSQAVAIQDGRDISKNQNGLGVDEGGPSYTIDQTGAQAVAHTIRSNMRNNSDPVTEAKMHVYQGSIVRRLTPMECERLQGFPDGYTLVPGKYKFKADVHHAILQFIMRHFNMNRDEAVSLAGNPDGPRYKALGNSMAVPVVRWIGHRIQLWEDLNK